MNTKTQNNGSFQKFAKAVATFGLKDTSVKATAHTSAVAIRLDEIKKAVKS